MPLPSKFSLPCLSLPPSPTQAPDCAVSCCCFSMSFKVGKGKTKTMPIRSHQSLASSSESVAELHVPAHTSGVFDPKGGTHSVCGREASRAPHSSTART